MPRLDDDALEQRKLPTGHFGYSAAALEDLGATEYTLVTIVQDVSGSVMGYKAEMEAALANVVKACAMSPRADNLLLRVLLFDDQLTEFHGFKMLEQCDPDDYDGCIPINGGMTALFAASANAIEAEADYGRDLADNDFSVNGLVVIITDGDNNVSPKTCQGVKKALAAVSREEKLESMLSILVGVGTNDYPTLSTYLEDFRTEAGITQYVEIDEASPKKIAKLGEFISQSVSSQSQALGSGAPSQPISLTV